MDSGRTTWRRRRAHLGGRGCRGGWLDLTLPADALLPGVVPAQDARSPVSAAAAVIELGSFDAAAERLHVTPSAISQRIKALDQRVGQVLVVWGRRGPITSGIVARPPPYALDARAQRTARDAAARAPTSLRAMVVMCGAIVAAVLVNVCPGGISSAQVTPSSAISRTPSYHRTGRAAESAKSSMTASALRTLRPPVLVR